MRYAGDELELFAGASNWKAYLAEQISPFIGGRVLEVGAGIGSNIPLLFNERVEHWLALEPDHELSTAIERKLACGEVLARCHVATGVIADLPHDQLFDAILYIDVLEHISDDRDEIACAARHLAPGGRLIVLSPAHQFLFSPFDTSIGHLRRYTRASLKALTPRPCKVELVRMLDSAGIIISLCNRLIMRSSSPTPGQITLWDKVFVPCSRKLDWLTGFRLGKSILLIWRSAAKL